MHTLQPRFFLRHARQLRALLLDGQPWFAARDLGRLINHPVERAPNRSLDPDQLRTERVLDARGLEEESLLISESGVYVVLLNCFHPENRCIRQWISNEVVPALREAATPLERQPRCDRWSWSGGQVEVLHWLGRAWVPFGELPRLMNAGGHIQR
ncbi:BRO-N domain-containing protein [Pseudomonas panipatensis]|uniref:BRO-N domain-containing protein n=1 Tax=Pseudomonas panipatensis TaxID=428992 RepID=UPI0035AEA2AB